jgi:two-component system CheB/CheR fusion protein
MLSWNTGREANWAETGEVPRSGQIYVVPPAHELEIRGGQFHLRRLPNNARSWLQVPDRLLCGLSRMCGADSVAVMLSGMLPAGVEGLKAVRAAGGVVITQSESSSAHFDMPCAGIDQAKAEIVFPPDRIAMVLNLLSEERSELRYAS